MLLKTRAKTARNPPARVQLLRNASGWELPQFHNTEGYIFAGGLLAGWVKEQWGFDVTRLRVVATHIDPADERWDWALIEMDYHGATEALSTATFWASRDDLANLSLAETPLWLLWKRGWPAKLHQVVSYVSIVSNLAPSSAWELAGGIDSFVRQLLLPTPGVPT